jgi:ribosomal protein L16 Arg81 hydroxylase
MRYEREIMPVMRSLLVAGDWLYIPAGYWHRTHSEEESISLSVGIQSVAAIDVYDFLRPDLLASLRWRQRLPTAGEASPLTGDELVAQLQEIFQELGNDLAGQLADKRFAERFVQALREPTHPSPGTSRGPS